MIGDIAGRLTGSPEGMRYMAMLWFYCDESYDQPSHAPRTYCVSGLLGEERTFKKLEANWVGINNRFGVERYHAAPLNALDGEYKGWDKSKQIQYSKRLLNALKKRGFDLQVTSIGIEADAYRKVYSDAAKERLGHPFLLCFKTCLTMIATQLLSLPPEYKFSVIFERNEHLAEAVRVFYLLKELDKECGPRMGTCTPGQWDENIALQPADLVAYESMRLLQTKRSGADMRRAFKELTGINSFIGYYFDKEIMSGNNLALVEDATCEPGGFFFTSRQFYGEYKDGDTWEDVDRKRVKE